MKVMCMGMSSSGCGCGSRVVGDGNVIKGDAGDGHTFCDGDAEWGSCVL